MHSAPGATQGLGKGATRVLREMALVERMSSGSGNTWGCGVHLEAVSATTAHVLVVDLTHGLKTLFT